MLREQEQSAARLIVRTIRAAGWMFLLVAAARCSRGTGHSTSFRRQSTLRIGVSVGQIGATNAQNGLRQVAPLLTNEGLLRVGRRRPANGMAGRRLARVARRAFDHAAAQAGRAIPRRDARDALQSSCEHPRQRAAEFMGPAASDIDAIAAAPRWRCRRSRLRQPSRFRARSAGSPGAEAGSGSQHRTLRRRRTELADRDAREPRLLPRPAADRPHLGQHLPERSRGVGRDAAQSPGHALGRGRGRPRFAAGRDQHHGVPLHEALPVRRDFQYSRREIPIEGDSPRAQRGHRPRLSRPAGARRPRRALVGAGLAAALGHLSVVAEIRLRSWRGGRHAREGRRHALEVHLSHPS